MNRMNSRTKSEKRAYAGLATLLATFLCFAMLGCSAEPPKSPDVADSIRKALDASGLNDVKVSQDRDKGIVTIDGKVTSDDRKAQAEAIARSIATTQVVANQILVTPPGAEKEAKAINSDLDASIGKAVDATLISRRWKKDVNYEVKNGVVTLTGEVRSQATREQVEKVLKGLPNVNQVVNNLQVKNQKATSSD